jgi:DNA-binding CsgD family transcriptional regulator
LQSIIERALGLLDLAYGAIYLSDLQDQCLVLTCASGSGLQTGVRLPPGQGIGGRVVASREPFILNENADWANLDDPSLPVTDMAAAVGLPMIYANEWIGVLVLADRKPRTLAGLQERLTILTARQREVVALMGQGFNNGQIAKKLGIRARTVETYRSEAIKRLGLDSGPKLIRFAMQHALHTE